MEKTNLLSVNVRGLNVDKYEKKICIHGCQNLNFMFSILNYIEKQI